MMIIVPSQIITIINKSHYEINSIICFCHSLRAQAAPSAATDLTVTIPLKAQKNDSKSKFRLKKILFF